jgi:hypothetical protein
LRLIDGEMLGEGDRVRLKRTATALGHPLLHYRRRLKSLIAGDEPPRGP